VGLPRIPEVEARAATGRISAPGSIEYEKEGDDDVRDDMRTNVAFAWKYGFSGA